MPPFAGRAPIRTLTILLLLALGAHGGEPREPWRALDRREGLPSEDVLDLCPSGAERLWAATPRGLCRIEAHAIDVLGPGRGLPAAAPRLLAPAPEAGVFALYPGAVVQVAADGRVRASHTLPVQDPAGRPPTALVSDGDAFWVLAGRRILHWSPATGRWTVSPVPEPVRGPSWLGVRDGSVVLGSPEGLWRLEDRERLSEDPAPKLPRGAWDEPSLPRPFTSLVRFRGELWGATRSRGILRKRIEPRFRRYSLPVSDRVHALARAPDGAVWCGTDNGIARIQGDGAAATTEIDGVPLGVVTACAVDREGRLWIGSGSSFTGVYRLDEDGAWRHFGAEEGFVDAFVHRITSDPSGTLWFAVLNAPGGSFEEGRGAWYRSEGEFRPAPATRKLPSGRIYDVVVRDAAGVLWFATLKGLAAFDGTRVIQYTKDEGLMGDKVWCLCAARDGSLWIGYQTEGGVSRLSSTGIEHFNLEDGLCDGNVWAVAEGEPGVFWFATENGLSRYDGKRWSCFRAEDGLGVAPIWPLLPLPDGTLWVGTLGAGVVHLVPDDREPPRTKLDRERYEAEEGEEVRISWTGTDAWFDTPSADLWYRWRRAGEAWSQASPETEVLLRAPAGRMVLEVQAIDRFGNAENPPRSVVVVAGTDGRFPWMALALGAALILLVGFLFGRRR